MAFPDLQNFCNTPTIVRLGEVALPDLGEVRMASKVTIEVFPVDTSVVIDSAHENVWDEDVWPEDRVVNVESVKLTVRGMFYLVSWVKAGKRYADTVAADLVKPAD